MKSFIAITQFVLVLFGAMLCGLFLTAIVGRIPIGSGVEFGRQWLIFASQNILAFILPALLTWKLCFRENPIPAIGASSRPPVKMIAFCAAIYVIAIPALNQMVWWNQEMHLPESMAAFESWCREMETQAEDQTKELLATSSVAATIMNIMVIGVLTGIGEEFFFRGALQRMLVACGANRHVAVWTGALVFSALHFQFFGFFPRLVLGVWFGYLYLWSGNIWVNSFAHALNNSLVIVSAWLINRGFLSEKFDMWGVSEKGFPLLPCISAVLVGVFIFCFLKKCHYASEKHFRSFLP